jgi:GAF domain-containing protein
METSPAHFELAALALACRDRGTLFKAFAARLGSILGARGALIWTTAAKSEEIQCVTCWTEPGERFSPAGHPPSEGFLFEILEAGETRRLGKQDLADAELDHLAESARSHVKSALYAVLAGEASPAGVIELLNKAGREFSEAEARFLEDAARFLSQAIANLTSAENDRQANLATVERLTALYDLGRTFTSILELEELLPIVARKVRDILGARACNIWLVDCKSNELYLSKQAGEDPTINEESRKSLTEGLLGSVAQQANAKLVAEAAKEEELTSRQASTDDFEIQSWMAAPLRKGDEVLGVLELVNKIGESPFDDEDLFFLGSISEQAAVALHNAQLLESERQVHALDALLKISQQITSTLDLDHVLTTVVNQAATVVPFETCVIGFFDRARFVLGAVSGEEHVPDTREMDELRERLEWVANQQEPVSANRFEGEWEARPEQACQRLIPFLEQRRYNGFHALPLRDEQGKIGALALLSSDGNFLDDSEKETVAILANQTTVAIRNAQLYQQIPLATILKPLATQKKKLLATFPEGRWRPYLERAAVVLALLILIPWPLRLGTNATVVPTERRIVSTIDGGVVTRVFVHEGEFVQAGQPLAQLENSEDRVRLAEGEAALAQSRRELAEAEFRNDPSAAGLAKIRTELHTAEVHYERQRLGATLLHAPIAGVIVTPKVDERNGAMLKPGEGFCEIVAESRMAAEMGVQETDLGLVQMGDAVALKLNAFPSRTFHGMVDRIGVRTHAEEGEQYFLVRAVFENPEGQARDGMVGRARIQTEGGWSHSGWYPVGYIILRTPVRWIWHKLWSWMP